MHKALRGLSVAIISSALALLLSSQAPDNLRATYAEHENIPIDGTITSHGCQIIDGSVVNDTIDYVEPDRNIEICNYDDKYYFRILVYSPSGYACPAAVGYWTVPAGGPTYTFSSICDAPRFYEEISCSGSEIQIRTNEKPYYILLESSNSGCTGFDFDPTQKRITMTIYARNQDNRMNVTIPDGLLEGKFSVMIDMGSTEDFLVDERVGYATISFYKFCPAGCNYRVDIIGSEVTSSELLQYSPLPTSVPLMMDAKGERIQQPRAGHQVIVFGNFRNVNPEEDQPYLMLFEFRDSQGITEFMAWQSGIANPDSFATAGVSWVPETGGQHQVRILVISNFEDPVVLRSTITYDILVV